MELESVIPDSPDWLILEIDESLSEITDPSVRAHALGRIITQYVPAVLKASDQNSINRAWGALFHYLIARPTKRKLWAMSEYQAISAVDKIKGSVERLSSILRSNIHKK